MTEDLVTFEEAARIAKVSPHTIKYWKKTGRLQTVPKAISARSGKPYGQLVPKSELVKAIPANRLEDMRRSHPEKNFLTVREICAILYVDRQLVYKLAKRLELEKHWIDGWNWVVDGNQFWARLKEDHYYSYLIKKNGLL